MTAKHTVLVLPFTERVLDDPNPILSLVYEVTQQSSESCTILFSPTSREKDLGLYTKLKAEPRKYWDTLQKFLGKIYATLSAAQWSVGKVLLDVEIGFEGYALEQRFGGKEVMMYNIHAYMGLPMILKLQQVLGKHSGHTFPTPTALSTLGSTSNSDNVSGSNSRNESASSSTDSGYATTALGGTFDHLHAAHKLLLHLSLFLTTRKLIVGVMTPSLLQSKSNSNLVQTLDERIRTTRNFLSRHGADVNLDVVEIHDPFGPTAWDSDIQALVVSKETISGGEAVNKKRKEKGLGELDVWVIDVIAAEPSLTSTPVNGGSTGEDQDRSGGGGGGGRGEDGAVKIGDLSHVDDEGELKALKMGSTAIRQWIRDHPSS